jgi:hypothetical protein
MVGLRHIFWGDLRAAASALSKSWAKNLSARGSCIFRLGFDEPHTMSD